MSVDFLHSFQAEPCILRGIKKINESAERCVQLANDVLRGEHHSDGHFAVDHCGGG